MSDTWSVFPHPESPVTRHVSTRHALITFFIFIYLFSFWNQKCGTVQSQPPKCYAFYTCFMKFCLALNSCKIWFYYILILFCVQEKPCWLPYCYCSHDVRPATHLAILNRLWRWGEMHSSQNTHPPCQSAEWLTREWTVTNKFHILYRKSGIHRRTGWDGGNVGKPGSVSCVIAIRDWIEGLSAFADPSRRYIEF